MLLYRCAKCDKYAETHELCKGCGKTWTSRTTIDEKKLKEQHARNYDLMEREHGKEMAEKQWKKAH